MQGFPKDILSEEHGHHTYERRAFTVGDRVEYL